MSDFSISIIGLVVGVVLAIAFGIWTAAVVVRTERDRREFLGFGHPRTPGDYSNLNRETPEAMRQAAEGKNTVAIRGPAGSSLGSGR